MNRLFRVRLDTIQVLERHVLSVHQYEDVVVLLHYSAKEDSNWKYFLKESMNEPRYSSSDRERFQLFSMRCNARSFREFVDDRIV